MMIVNNASVSSGAAKITTDKQKATHKLKKNHTNTRNKKTESRRVDTEKNESGREKLGRFVRTICFAFHFVLIVSRVCSTYLPLVQGSRNEIKTGGRNNQLQLEQ